MSNHPHGSSPNDTNRRQSAKVDPWEARERERERYSRTPSSSRSRESQGTDAIWLETDLSIQENYLVGGLLIAVALLVGSGIPRIEDNYRYFLLEIGTFLVVLLLGTCRSFQEKVIPALRRPLNVLILALAAWTAFAFFESPYRNFASTEMMRIASGVGLYFLAAYALKSPRQVSIATAGLIFLGGALSLFDFAEIGARGGQKIINNEFSLLGTHEHIGSILTLLFPVSLIFALHPEIEEKRRLTATAATIILAAALLVSRSRSGWVSTFLALIVLTVLYLRYVRPQTNEGHSSRPLWQRFLLSPMAQVSVALVIFISLTSLAPLISKRATNLRIMDDAAFVARLELWQGAQLMIGEKPLTGWGLGTFPVLQGQFSHAGDDTALVLRHGATHDNNAHNYYLQWGAETGVIGIILHLGVLTAFIVTGFQKLPRASTPFQTALIAGTMAAVIASLIESTTSPMYHFAGVWAILYTWIGLGTAGMRPIPGKTKTTRGAETTTPAPSTGPWLGRPDSRIWIISLSFSVVAGLGIVGIAWQRVLAGHKATPGTLQLMASPVGPVSPGQSIYWTAVYTDPKGVVRSTIPGTIWYLQAEPLVMAQGEQALLSLHPGETQDHPLPNLPPDSPNQSVFRLTVPMVATPGSSVTIKATYRDYYGRLNEAWSTKSIVLSPSTPAPSPSPAPTSTPAP